MKKILLVDDEKGVVAMMKNYFEMSGYQVLTAYNGVEALRQAAHQPDIILLDINMPGMDGLTVCQRIRESISCPILFLTARIEKNDKINGFHVGADDYIIKPFDIDELGARVAAHLRRENRKQEQMVATPCAMREKMYLSIWTIAPIILPCPLWMMAPVFLLSC